MNDFWTPTQFWTPAHFAVEQQDAPDGMTPMQVAEYYDHTLAIDLSRRHISKRAPRRGPLDRLAASYPVPGCGPCEHQLRFSGIEFPRAVKNSPAVCSEEEVEVMLLPDRRAVRAHMPYVLRIVMGRLGRLSALHGTLFLLGVAGLVISLVGLDVGSMLALTLGLVGILLSVIGIVAQVIEDWVRVSRIYFDVRAKPFDASYSAPYDGWSRVHFNGHSSVHSEELDARLRDDPVIPLEIEPGLWNVPAEYEEARQLVRVRLDFDDAKIRLHDDLDAEADVVRVQRTRYSAHTVTNLLGEKVLRERQRQREMVPGDAVLLRSGLIPRLRHSRCSNHLGVDVVAVSSSGRVVLTLQGEKNTTNQGMLAPSGSGSMDWADLQASPDLLGLVKYAMLREMSEELGLRRSEQVRSSDVRVLRYTRVTNWGGKPQFCGVARLGDVREQVRGIEHRYHRDHFSIEFDPDGGAQHFVATVRSYVQDNAARVSFPLYETLDVLCAWLERDPQAWTWLMTRG
ncbi:hypothetical protein [Streptomyces sp. NBC_01601]|uniref:hypothetical protein n=1 Tax=Streptomyces sp. NBC_01601 TaxID=2975892 RepID=UPI002E2985D3|nr:hypothetical protein [Streptomyces sp. NBC_01601]